MRSLWLQAAILLVVTCCLTRGAHRTPNYTQCSDWKIPKSLENKTMAELLEDFKDHNSSKNHTHKCQELTVTQLIAHALNTTGNTSLTVSTLGLPHPGCLKYFGFTLIEVALQNLEDPDMFPGNKTVKEILYLLFSEVTQTVVNNVDRVVDGLEKNGSVDLMKTIHHLTRKGHFNPHSQFLQVLCLAVNASDLDQAASRLGIDKDLLVNATFLQMTDYLFTSVDAYQKNLSLACAIRHLHSAKLFLEQLREFLKKERMVWEEKTLRELFDTYNASVESRTVFSVIKEVFKGHLNLTFLQFFGARRVSLKLFEYNVVTFAKVTFMSESVMFNFTMKQFFHFLDDYGEVMNQYKENMEMAEKRREKILSRYNCKVDDLMQAPFNKTQSEIRLMKDRDIENHAIRCFFKKYAEDRNITLKELESRSNITKNTLVEYNATVYNFMDILYNISKANILEAIKDQKAVVGIITHYHMLCSDELRKQIRIERHPLVTDWKYLIELEISYFIFQKRWNVSVIYEENIYDFVVDYLKPSSWRMFLSIIGIKNPGNQDFLRVFKKYSFKDLSKFYRLEKYTILRWKLSFFFKFMVEKIENDVDECRVGGKYPCARIHGVECVNFPGGAMCECPSDKNLDKYRGCEDIDECDLKSTSCRNNSHCVNTDGSYECRCNTGFKEVNDKCEDVDECKKQWNRCVFANAECVNTIGSFTCRCRLGSVFSVRRGVCVDIDECKQQPCKAVDHSVCVDLEPYYRCDCPDGFITDRNTSVSQNGPLLNCTDINECVSGKHDCDQHATCTNTLGSYTCKCKEGYVRDGSKCRAEKFFEVDQSKCKTILPREYDSRHNNKKYARLNNPLGFYFNGKTYHKLYIHIDGKISIDKKYKRRTPKKLSSVKKNLLCPFWASAELSKKADSSLRYCEVYADDSGSSSLLTKINKFVTNSTKLSDFQADWVLIVTWTRMVPSFWRPGWWGRSRPSPHTDERNTFQAVIATSGSNTVLVYLYEDGGMTWDPTGIDVAVGYALKSGSENSFQVDDSFTEKIFRIDRKQFTDPAGNERTGCYVKVFKPPKPTPPTPEDNCLAWIRRTSKRHNKWVEGLPDCPCTLSSMEYDGSFDKFFDGNDVKCYVRHTWSQQRTKSCCYYTDSESYGALVPDSDSRAGRALRYNPNNRPSQYQQDDVNSYDWCCDQSTKYCGDFKQLRPADEGCEDNGEDDEEPERPCECRWSFGFRWRRPRRRVIRRFFFGFFFGDPHITTLDGVKYSFNGLGEYVVLETNDKSNRIHGRTKRPPKKDGGLSKATVFSGFSLRSSKNTTVQVFYNDSVAGNLNIGTLNESGHYEQFCINTLKQVRGFFLRRSTKDNITLEVVFDSGLVAKITPGKGFLQISFLIPGSFVNNTRGLLGKMNNDKHDDLMYRNGTTKPIDSTEREIFRYGQTWKVQNDEAMFLNGSGYKEPVYFEADFVPEFLSECNVTDRMRKVCNNQSECLLDYCLTGDESFANATNKYEEESEKVKKIVENLPPVITVTPKVVHVKAGQRLTVKVTVTDPNKDATTLNSTTLPKNAVFSNGTFKWTPPTGLQKPPKIQFIAKDTSGAVNVKPLEIRYCDCKNGGECDFNTTLKSFANSSLKLVGCKCEANSTGDLCETAVKPCEDNPCFKSVSCAVTQKPFGFKCGSCPAGHEGNGEICSDFDECLNATRNNCTENEKCKNIVGSFKCDCKPGFKRGPNSKNCTDVDECTDIGVNINCKANTTCNNTRGSYQCQCKPGYEGDPTTKGCKDIDECQGASRKCFGHYCDNKLGSFNCRCKHGFKLEQKQNKTFQCVDIDECKFPVNNNCSQTCINVPSTFTCGCKEGFKLDSDKRSCSVDPNKKCHGSHGCEWKCTNTSKNATCHCPKGFNLTSNGKTCEDIDECKGNSGCSQKCDNIKGSYKCLCNKGYKPMKDKRSCKEIDECLQKNGGCSQKCKNKPGKRQCSCKRGYLVPKNNETQCEDIDECKAENKCSKHGQQCINRPGGYKCRCKDRHKFSNGKSPCKKSKKYRYKLRCRKLGNRDLEWQEDYDDEFSEAYQILLEYIIENFDVFFKKLFGESYIGCDVLGFWPGSVMANVTLNFDSNSSVTAGNLTSALQGTSNVGNLVVDPTQSAVTDVDECSDGTNNCHVDATCENVPGSFSCHCKEGYQGDGTDCEAVSKKKEDDNKKKIMIILLCTLIPLAVIILVIIICCYCKRKSKGNLYMSEDDTNNVNLRQTSNGDGTTYYGKGNGRRGSHDYEEPGPGNGSGGTYDLPSASYYDNPAAISEKQEAKL